MMRFPVAAGVLASVIGMLALAGGATAEEYAVIIDKMAFGAVPAEMHVGDVIVWQNEDIFWHTATDRGGTFDIDLPAGKSGRFTLAAAGSFAVYCRFHPGMKLSLNVDP